eukprot:TRINITY_DN1705_c0_g1_i2.p1 TRINITY_DN1705_c0_g1~~TRINITY_DN1705_c0_g1_i2.p1  ORF type:complete len:153 (-),score=48.94 TRINITY_DN1705_c0_g1_i2:313-771(-)
MALVSSNITFPRDVSICPFYYYFFFSSRVGHLISSMVEADVGGGYSDLEHTQQQLEAARSRLNDIQWELHLFTDAFGIFVCSREAASGGEEADRVNNRAGYLLKGDSLINVGQALPSFSSSSSCIPPHSPPPPSQFVANYTAINDLWRRLEH